MLLTLVFGTTGDVGALSKKKLKAQCIRGKPNTRAQVSSFIEPSPSTAFPPLLLPFHLRWPQRRQRRRRRPQPTSYLHQHRRIHAPPRHLLSGRLPPWVPSSQRLLPPPRPLPPPPPPPERRIHPTSSLFLVIQVNKPVP
jgi:hypothetical protein